MELALVLPLVVAVLLLVVQVGLVVRDQVLVVHAAREGAREAAVDADPAAARRVASSTPGLTGGKLDVAVSGRRGAGSRVTVAVSYRSPTAVPLVGGLLPDVRLRARATMRVER